MKTALVSLLVLSGIWGCSHTRVEKVALVELNNPASATVVSAPRDGMYQVQILDGRHYLKTPIYSADRWLRRGEPVGFRASDDGALIAVAASQEVALTGLPPNATHLMWYHKSTKPTQFAKSAGKFFDAAGRVAMVTVVGVGIAGLAAGELYLITHPSCDEGDYACAPPKHHHQKR